MDSFFQHLLLNNRAPNPYEAQVLADLRAQDADSLERLMSQVPCAETVHSDAIQAVEFAEQELVHRKRECEEAAQCKWALSTKIESMLQRVLSYELVLSPLRQLPDEVLSEIFLTLHASQLVDYDTAKTTQIVNSPITLSHVSNQWRRVALTTPRLWSFIQITASGWPFARPLLEHYLIHSRSTHLRLCLEDVVRDTPLDGIFRFLRPHKARITDLQYRLENIKGSSFDFEDYLWEDYPFNTSTFRIIDHSVLAGAGGATLNLPHYNRVTRLFLLNVSMEGLEHTRDPALVHLEVLEWKSSRRGWGPCVTQEDICALFSRAPSLKRLYVENLWTEEYISSQTSVEKPHGLLHLSTRNTDHCIFPHGDCNSFPHLQSLSLHGDGNAEVSATIRDLGTSLTTLSLFELTYSDIDSDDDIDRWDYCLKKLQKLERLELFLNDYLFDVIMQALLRIMKNSPSNLPSLRVIHIDTRSVTPGASLVEFIRRRKAIATAAQLESLVLGSPDVFEGHVLRELNELVSVEFARFDPSIYALEEGKEQKY